MTVILKNNAFGFLQSPISNSDTSLVLQSGYGASFPNLGAGEYFYATISPTSGASEVVKATARVGDILTVVRAQEGTSAQAFAAGSRVELRVTAQSVIDAITDRVAQYDQASEISIADAGGYYTGTNVEAALQEAALSATTRFTPAGTGVTTRSVQDTLRYTIRVTDFGAFRDGTNASATRAAIQAAIDYAQSNTNVHCIEFPTGNYAVNGVINIKGSFGYGLFIKGNKSTLTSSHNGIVFDCDAALPSPAPAYRQNLNISDMTIVGPGKANTSSVGVKLYGANYSMNNVIVTGFYRALYGLGCLISEFVQCKFENSHFGIEFDHTGAFAPNDVHFYKCNMIDCIQAIKYMNFDYGSVTFIGCEIEGNNLAGNATDGVKVCEFGGSPNGAGEVTFIGCHWEMNPGQYNIYFNSPAGRHLNIIGGKVIPGDVTGSCVYVDYGELYLTGTMCIQNVGNNIQLTANTGSALVVGDTGGTITGTVTKLVRIREGTVYTGGVNPGSSAAGIGAKGRLGVGAVVEGTLWFSNSSGSRLGYVTETGLTLDAAAQYRITSGNGQLLFFRTGKVVEPASDNQYSLGTAPLKWSEVWAGNGAIQTSDERLKQQIEPIPQAWLDAWGDVDYVRFKFNDAVEKKGSGARWHVGLIAQRVKEAFEARGIDPFAIGILCYDKWDDVEVEEQATDENGNFVVDAETGEVVTQKKLVRVAGDQYALRYEQALALECAYLRSKLNGGV